MRRLLPILLILAACGNKNDSPPPAEKVGLPIVPDSIANQLGNANTVVAVDLHGWDTTKLGKMLPPGLDCVREIVASAGLVVAGTGDASNAFVTGVPEAPIKKCVETLGPLLSAHGAMEGDTYVITTGDTKVSLVWGDGLVKIEEVGHPVKPGPPSAALRAQIAKVPANAMLWFASSGFPKQRITRAVGYMQSVGTEWRLVLDDESSEPHLAKKWSEDLVAGFKEGAAEKHITVDDRWFTLSEPTPTTAHLDATIPFGIFSSVGQGVNE